MQGRKRNIETKAVLAEMKALKWPTGHRGMQAALAAKMGVSVSTIRYHLKKAGVIE